MVNNHNNFKIAILSLLLLISASCFPQVSDSDIAKSLLGKKQYEATLMLDSLKVWYRVHFIEDNKNVQKVISIANNNEIVKVFTLKIDDQNKIREVIINYRHDDKKQLEDLDLINDATDIHIGKYSTDVTFK